MKTLFKLICIVILLIGVDYIAPRYVKLINQNHYLLGFENFRSQAKDTLGQERIIFVGGSSLAWGVSAEDLTGELGVLTLNAGIQAGVGYRNFMRTISDVIDADKDIIVISPEYSIVSEGGEIGRSREFCEIALYALKTYPIDCIGYSINKMMRVTPLLDARAVKVKTDEYIRHGFNSYGDYVHRIEGRNMIGKMDDDNRCSGWTLKDLERKYSPYIEKLITKGYKVLYVPNFIPTVTCPNPEKAQKFHNFLQSRYGVKGLEASQLLFDEKYFYNTPYHLTKEGVAIKTKIFENHLRSYLLKRSG